MYVLIINHIDRGLVNCGLGMWTDFNGFSRSIGLIFKCNQVQCGLGRTGRLWAHEAYDVKPDIMTLAKPLAGGLPIGAVLVTERVASSIAAGDHGSTFAGGPLVCHAALAVLDRIQVIHSPSRPFLDPVLEIHFKSLLCTIRMKCVIELQRFGLMSFALL